MLSESQDAGIKEGQKQYIRYYLENNWLGYTDLDDIEQQNIVSFIDGFPLYCYNNNTDTVVEMKSVKGLPIEEAIAIIKNLFNVSNMDYNNYILLYKQTNDSSISAYMEVMWSKASKIFLCLVIDGKQKHKFVHDILDRVLKLANVTKQGRVKARWDTDNMRDSFTT